MNKKQRLLLGVSIVVVLLGYLSFNGLESNQYEVGEAVAARENLTGKIIVVNGTLVSGTDQWDSLNRTLTFKMTDGAATLDVVFTGDKPDIPPEAENIQVVATGQFNNNVFSAFRMLTKCPSKYEAEESIYVSPEARKDMRT